MASAKQLAGQPLPDFVVERMKLWDEYKALAEKDAAGTPPLSLNSPCREFG